MMLFAVSRVRLSSSCRATCRWRTAKGVSSVRLAHAWSCTRVGRRCFLFARLMSYGPNTPVKMFDMESKMPPLSSAFSPAIASLGPTSIE